MDKLVHKPDGELVVDNPWIVGRKVRRLKTTPSTQMVRPGTIGEINGIDSKGKRIIVKWPLGRYDSYPFSTLALEIIAG